MCLNEEKSNQSVIQVAGLRLELDGRGVDLKILPPLCYEEFLKPVVQPQAFLILTEGGRSFPYQINRLVLKIKGKPLEAELSRISPLYQYDNWEIKFDRHGNFVLEALRLPPSRRVIVNPEFSSGEVQGDFSDWGEKGFYPLKDMDMKLFVNWLALSGDIILHASGLVVDGKGYAFAGKAGAGKSTLASFLLHNHGFTVLGEDQVVLRYIQNRFWIFGTPWHENPRMCSPIGAPLEKLFFLVREMPYGMVEVKPVDSISQIMQTAFVPYYRQDLMSGIMDRLGTLSVQVPSYAFSYQLGSDPWPLIARS